MFLFIFIVTECLISTAFMIMVAGWINSIKIDMVKASGIVMLNTRTSAFAINMVISSIIGEFTGSGMTSGFANLTSSVLVAIYMPAVLEAKYKFDKFLTDYRSRELTKSRERRQRKQNKQHKVVNSFASLKSKFVR